MKTNTKKYISRLFLLCTSIVMATGFFCNSASALATIPASSGLKNQFYALEWCSPHYSRLTGSWSTPCRTGYFSNVWGVAKIVYDGTNYTVGNVAPNYSASGFPSTRTSSTTPSASELVDFFSSITGGAFAMEGEGVVKIKAYLVDFADNVSYFTITYRIDKTAPQLTLNSMSESTDYTYYGGRVNSALTVNKYDSASDSSSGDSYGNPAISQYTGNGPVSRPNHQRGNLHAFYFQNTISGIGANSPFISNVSYSDAFNGYFTSSASWSDGASAGSLVSGERKFQLISANGNDKLADLGLSTNVTLSTLNLFDNSGDDKKNSQRMYRLRLYDNTVGSNGAADTGNYSETAFYAVRDNTAPNMGGNGLAGTNQNQAIESVLKFPDNETVFDLTTTGYNPSVSGFSRFLAASNTQPINYNISDVGITGDANISGAGCTDYALCNAGLDTSTLQVNIESANTPGTQQLFTNVSDRFLNTGTKNKDFSLTGNGTLASNGTYRYYSSQFQSNGIPSLCDMVGNCIAPNLKFRVVANTVNGVQSKLSVVANSESAGNKIIANGSDSYKLSYSLRDTYGNKIVPVQSVENAGSPVIKTIETIASFINGLASDQRTNIPSGTKLVSATDLESDTTTFNNAINSSSTVTMREGLANPNGDYTLSLASKVPTKGFYPYLSNNSVLQVQSLSSEASGTASSSITYPKTGSRIGYFAPTTYSAGSANAIITPDVGNLAETGGFNNISLDSVSYGKYSTNSSSNITFNNLVNRKINFEYASPLVYGLVGLKTLIDGQFMQHYKKLYNVGGLANTAYNIYEKNIVAYDTDKDEQPGVLNFEVRTAGAGNVSTPISSGVRYTANNSLGSFFLTGSPALKSFPIIDATGSGYSTEIQMSAIAGKTYDNTKLRMGLVSGLTYSLGADTIQLPSVARNISSGVGGALDQYSMARHYFSDDYRIGGSTAIGLASAISDIAIIGLTNTYNSITTDTKGTKANVNVETELSRTDLVATIKKNVAQKSAGFAPSSATSGKRWCSGVTINQNFIDNASGSVANDCTQTINGEVVSFIDGNSTLECAGTNICRVSNKRSIVVQNGSLYVKSNVTTLNSLGTQTAGQFFLGVMSAGWLSNINVDPNVPDITSYNKSGWLLVNPAVTNIDAFVFSQGPTVSYNGTNFFSKTLTTEKQLRNQLHIMGSALTLNNIGGSKKTPIECPYIVENCTEDIAQIFDFVYLRRFTLQPKSTFTGNAADDSILVPYHPDGSNIAKKSGGETGDEPNSSIIITCSWDLRCITDHDYRPYPILIERDMRWNANPSVFFETN